LRGIRGVSKRIPVIVITAHSTVERAERCINLRAHAYIRKPFDNDELFDTATEILRENENTGNIAVDDSKSHAAAEGGRVLNPSLRMLSSRIQEAIKFIDDNWTRPIRARDVAEAVALSRKHLGRLFKKEMKQSVDGYINWRRIQEAKKLLLLNRDTALSKIVEELGFTSEDHFQRTFKRFEGKTPGAFRQFRA
jgi:YesN/AraC family two-component response regulator